MVGLERGLELRNGFLNLADKHIELLKEIKKEADKENIKSDDNNFIEWFIFEKKFQDGKNAIDIYLEMDFSDEEKELILTWKNYIFSIFKVKKEDKGNYVLLNMINNQKYCVNIESCPQKLEIGSHIVARILPFKKDLYIFTNTLCEMVIDTNEEIYGLIAQFELDYPHSAFTDNKNKMETSYKIQELEYDDFVNFFGNDEIIVKGSEIPEKLHEFYHYRYFQKKDKSTGKTIAKIFREKYGTYPDLPSVELPESLLELDEVGIVYDYLEGLNFLPWYGIFKEIFRKADFKEIPGYKECINEYLKSDTISTLPFKKVMREFPENTILVMKDILNRKRFNLPEDFNKVMEKYKKNIMDKSLEPTIIPMPERTKALLRAKKTEEYSSLHFFEAANRYKDIKKYCNNS